MIWVILFYVVKKIKAISMLIARFEPFKRAVRRVVLIVLILLVARASAISSFYSDNTGDGIIVFQVLRNENVIGTIEIHKRFRGDSIIYTVDCDVEVKFIFKFNAVGKEKYIFKDGTLIYSSLYRTLNKSVKTNHRILYDNGTYSLQTPEKISPLELDYIKNNLMLLYLNEPKGVTSVFCDHKQQRENVKALGEGIYKVEISNGKYNIFHYEKGKCIKVEAVSPLFSVTLIPMLS